MNSPDVGVGVGVRGKLFDCPVDARVWTEQGALSWEGVLHVRDKGVSDLIELVDTGLLDSDDPVRALLALVDQLIGSLSFDLDVLHQNDLTRLELDLGRLKLRVLRRSAGTALAVYLADSGPSRSDSLGWILKSLQEVQSALGIQRLFLVYRRAPSISLSELTGEATASLLPSVLSSMTWLACGRFAFAKDSTAGAAISTLLGISGLDAYLGLDPGKSSYAACLSFGTIDNALFRSHELYLAVGLTGGEPVFSFKGSFQFKFLPEVFFIANCDISAESFTLAAQMQATNRVALPLIPGFYLAEAGLLVGVTDGAPTFGIFATIYIRDLMVFGAVLLALEGGEVPVPLLVSAAIDPVSLPILYRNLTGSDLSGLDSLDVVSLDRLAEISLPAGFDPSILPRHDAPALAEAFNKAVHDNITFSLDPDHIHLRTLDHGYALVDQARMRHYFIDRSGKVFLQSQFYLSIQPTARQFGGYWIMPGVFFCGALELFGKRFEALFALRKDEGLLAYAKLDRIDFSAGSFLIFSVRASDDTTKDPKPLDSGGLADQFIPARPAGAVFFLSACKTEVTFFLSGHVEFLGLFRLDARVVYASRYLSLHTEIVIWGIRVVLQLDISWLDFSHSRFAFKLQIDTSELLAALAAVTQAIDRAILALKASMASAQSSLNAAQGRVDQLRHEIAGLDSRIAGCKEAIDRASWWQKVFVAIAKGAEIAAYEVAEAGIWTAIGVATAALDVAKLAVALFGDLGSAILELVNSTIRAATSLLFLRSAEISADISPQQQKFRAAIAFRALGKDYTFSAQVSLDLLQGGDLMQFLTDQLLGLLGPDLANVSKGKAPRLPAAPVALYRAAALGPLNAFVTTRENILDPDSIPPIGGAAREIERVTGILELLQTRYRETFGADLAEFAALNANFTTALQLSASSLEVASQAARQPEYSDLLQGVAVLDTSGLAEADKNRLQASLGQLSEALQTRSLVSDARRAAVTALLMATERTRVSALPGSASESAEETDQRMVQFLTELEKEIHRRYGDAIAGYIDLSLEPALKAHFEAAHQKLGSPRPAPLRAARAMPARAYRPRL